MYYITITYIGEVGNKNECGVDNDLMKSALKVSGLKTKKDAKEKGLKLLVQVKGQKDIIKGDVVSELTYGKRCKR